ncbi:MULTISPECIES: alpha/beta hydrolase [unclassified Janthinobacterium]|uniref:alpha/beta hydrolase n=1 Tax=unclassified Janthinobacterium TaxID=2610881 RepID=UPI0016135FB1|nr:MULTISPECIES: alpha/beta hydrolase [unclassified Janthinobacterium]MBB5366675.1 acetyl esterase/lipase [Janthinobacterium sp. K2C7]MBB5380847.1 acetyl esterase/lipase [Janthinobacterium sp. K2Li3]MBB5385057.1 acetyl esterase/lipase [Janthinobacterium sp. K2E3]
MNNTTRSTLPMVDPAARPLAQAFAAFDPARQGITQYRASLAQLFPASAQAADTPHEERMITGGPGGKQLRLLIHRPQQAVDQPLPAILFLHASGFISGTPDMFSKANQAMAQQHQALVLSVQYRLAPESPFPAPLHDAYAALAWLVKHAQELGIDPARIIVMGESAGGGLAAMLALLARDRGQYRLAGQVLIYPMLDPRTGGVDAPVQNPTTGEFVWTASHNQFAWSALRGEKVDEAWQPYFAPALAQSLTALPPTFIAVGALDLFLEEDVAYALRLSRAGVPVETHVYPGAIHGFDFVDSAVATQYHADLAAALSRLLAPTPED